MITPLLIVAIVAGPWLIVRFIALFGFRLALPATAGLAGLVLAFLFFALGHFVQTDEMIRLLPAAVPARREIVWLTGLLELAIAAGLSVPATRQLSAALAMAVLVLFLPANIYGALQSVDYGGHALGPAYLLVRIPLQIFLLVWVWAFAWQKSPEA